MRMRMTEKWTTLMMLRYMRMSMEVTTTGSTINTIITNNMINIIRGTDTKGQTLMGTATRTITSTALIMTITVGTMVGTTCGDCMVVRATRTCTTAMLTITGFNKAADCFG
jgi:hypothetical protein